MAHAGLMFRKHRCGRMKKTKASVGHELVQLLLLLYPDQEGAPVSLQSLPLQTLPTSMLMPPL